MRGEARPRRVQDVQAIQVITTLGIVKRLGLAPLGNY